MKVYLDQEEIFEIDSNMIKLLEHEILNVLPDIKRRLKWVIDQRCDDVYKKLKLEYIEKSMQNPDVESIPADKNRLLDLIFSDPGYKNRSQRESEKLNI